MNTIEILTKLCDNGQSTDDAKNFAANYLSNAAQKVTLNGTTGNVVASFRGDGKRIVVDAHMDKIGLTVVAINDKGFLKVSPVGGVDRRVLLSAEVTVYGKQTVFGVISCLPPHLVSKDTHKAVDRDEIYVDVGMTKEQAEREIPLGSFVAVNAGLKVLKDDKVTAAALDDRAGVAALLLLADKLKNEKNLPCSVDILLSDAEEVGCRGARPGVFSLDPDEAIVVDVTFGSDKVTPTAKSGKLGGGPMVGIAPVLDREMTDSITAVADGEKIEYQYEVMGGEAGTNADVISDARRGIKTAMISIPLRNMHTAAEVVSIKDVEATAEMIYHYLMSGGNKNV